MLAPSGRIDCHVHYYASAFADRILGQGGGSANVPIRGFVASRPGWRDITALTEVMDQTQVGLGVILANSTMLGVLRGCGPGASEAYNRSMSADLAAAGDRFLAAAVADPFGGREEVQQLDRSLSLPRIGALGLVASYDGVALDDAAFEPLFEVAREHDVPVLVHPSSVAQSWKDTLRLDNNVLEAGLGFLLDDALCIMRMAINGTFDRFPGVRFMFCQLGGFTSACCSRWDFHCRQQKLIAAARGSELPAWASHALTDYLSHVWVDTHSQDRHMLRLVLDMVGDSGIVLGGDYPLTVPEDGIFHIMAELRAMGAPATTIARIERENALRLLNGRQSS